MTVAYKKRWEKKTKKKTKTNMLGAPLVLWDNHYSYHICMKASCGGRIDVYFTNPLRGLEDTVKEHLSQGKNDPFVLY